MALSGYMEGHRSEMSLAELAVRSGFTLKDAEATNEAVRDFPAWTSPIIRAALRSVARLRQESAVNEADAFLDGVLSTLSAIVTRDKILDFEATLKELPETT